MKLKIIMEDFSGTVKEAYYDSFRIEDQVYTNANVLTRVVKDDFDTYRWDLCPSCKVGNLLLFSDSAPIDKFYFTPIDMLCYW